MICHDPLISKDKTIGISSVTVMCNSISFGSHSPKNVYCRLFIMISMITYVNELCNHAILHNLPAPQSGVWSSVVSVGAFVSYLIYVNCVIKNLLRNIRSLYLIIAVHWLIFLYQKIIKIQNIKHCDFWTPNEWVSNTW